MANKSKTRSRVKVNKQAEVRQGANRVTWARDKDINQKPEL